METSNNTSSLTERLKSWRSELKGTNLTKEEQDELQNHMEDVLDELLSKGLSEDEAWIAAVHRIGEIRDIQIEYKKVQDDRIPLFNHTLFWILLLFLGIQLMSIGENIILLFTRIGQIPFFTFFCFVVLCLLVWWIISTRKVFREYSRLGVFTIVAPLILLSLIFGFLTHYDGPQCYNSNEVFRNNRPKSDVYVTELVKHFTQAGSDNLYYRFGYYYRQNNRDYIVLKAIGKDFCGLFSLDITNSKRLEKLIRVKGKSYSGSMWRGLKFDLVTDKSGIRFIFKSVEQIVD